MRFTLGEAREALRTWCWTNVKTKIFMWFWWFLQFLQKIDLVMASFFAWPAPSSSLSNGHQATGLGPEHWETCACACGVFAIADLLHFSNCSHEKVCCKKSRFMTIFGEREKTTRTTRPKQTETRPTSPTMRVAPAARSSAAATARR